MKLPISGLLLAGTFGLSSVACAQGLPDAVDLNAVNTSALEAYVQQAQQAQAAETSATAAQEKALPVDVAALPSTDAQAVKPTVRPPSGMDRAILDQLIEINGTLKQLLEAEQAKAAAAH